ncbi:hypothetical protein B0T20DRAFT_412091 [Sordaria brevicollis]|uniref:Secreted protein n=1 Tax=Sordaria brevicollis TaxID=83679 RepID=A0AAE0PF53_SORBR|nr:hypothetical protein B0T20DRAFT_412091 [Sordaria brevicollis]
MASFFLIVLLPCSPSLFSSHRGVVVVCPRARDVKLEVVNKTRHSSQVPSLAQTTSPPFGSYDASSPMTVPLIRFLSPSF